MRRYRRLVMGGVLLRPRKTWRTAATVRGAITDTRIYHQRELGHDEEEL